ncbi:MAG: VanZ family protein [Streptococcaceae bacterium]|jgi:VanZ family protein|nr:VanZ family protein [Streptococcaceae bacterium]
MLKKNSKNGKLWFALALVMMGVLFWSSSQTYHQQSQVGTLSHLLKGEPFKDVLSKIKFNYAHSEISIQHMGYFRFVEFFLRKGAHFFSYLLIGAGLFLGFSKLLKSSWLPAALSVSLATTYAGLDEFHQMLTGDRSPLVQDVILDASGAATIVVILLVVKAIREQRVNEK